jgi:hypothetical protein
MLGDNFLQVNGGLSARFYSFKRLLLAVFGLSFTQCCPAVSNLKCNTLTEGNVRK